MSIVLNSKPKEIDPFFYGFIDCYEEYLEKDGEYEYYKPYGSEHSYCVVDRGFYKVHGQEEWNAFIASCDLDDLPFIDEHFEVIQEVLSNAGRFVFTGFDCNIFENYSHLRLLYEDANMSHLLNKKLEELGYLKHIQECLNYFGEEEFENILEYGKEIKRVNYTVQELIEQVEGWNNGNITYNSFVHKFYDEEYELYLIWCYETDKLKACRLMS